MALSVIGAGFGRTGTMSLKLALEELGLGVCHHMDEVFANPEQLPNWQAAAAGETVDWDAVYAGYDCTADWPGASFWRPLSEHYPEARIILTMRPVESWWESYSNTIMKFFLEMLPQVPDDHVRNTGNMAKKVISKWAFGTADIDDRQAATAAYEAHVAAVSDAFSDDRLLKFDVREGWEPLCAFLDKLVREGEFPRSNSSEEFWEIVEPRD